ncbi:type II secretion system protein N [Chitinibacteraceae bacterium HSL-7]
MKRIGLITMTLLVFALLQWPASLCTFLLPAPLRAGGISGTIWQGEAAQFGIGERQLLGRTQWQFEPEALMRAQLAWRITGDGGQVRAVVSPGGWSLEQVDVTLPIWTLLALDRRTAGLGLSGSLRVIEPHLDAKTQRIGLNVAALGSALTPNLNPLGDYRVELSRQAQQMHWQVAPQRGRLQLSGNGTVAANGVQGALTFTVPGDDLAQFKPLLDLIAPGSGPSRTLALQ